MIHLFFFFNDTATTEIYTLSLHDALPISKVCRVGAQLERAASGAAAGRGADGHRPVPRHPSGRDRKSTRLNSSHLVISYAVFCLKKKNEIPLEDARILSCRNRPATENHRA